MRRRLLSGGTPGSQGDIIAAVSQEPADVTPSPSPEHSEGRRAQVIVKNNPFKENMT